MSFQKTELNFDQYIKDKTIALVGNSESLFFNDNTGCEIDDHDIVIRINDPIVSSDVVGNSHSGIIDGLATMGINDTKIKVLIWFDNGWGYSARIIDTINKLSESSTHE